MPCSQCRTTGHTKPKCPQYAMDRALSIINDGIDLAPYNALPDMPITRDTKPTTMPNRILINIHKLVVIKHKAKQTSLYPKKN